MRLSELAGELQPVEATVPMILDGKLADRIRRRLAQAEKTQDLSKAHLLLKEAEELAKTALVREFTFRQLDPSERFHEILDAIPRGAGDKMWDEARLWPAVVYHSMTSPVPDEDHGEFWAQALARKGGLAGGPLYPEGFASFWKQLSWGQRQGLFDAAWSVNVEAVGMPFLQAVSEITQRSRETSATRQAMESRSASSEAAASKRPPRTPTTKKAGSPKRSPSATQNGQPETGG